MRDARWTAYVLRNQGAIRIKVGTGTENEDGSIALELDASPIDGRFLIVPAESVATRLAALERVVAAVEAYRTSTEQQTKLVRASASIKELLPAVRQGHKAWSEIGAALTALAALKEVG